MYAQPHQKQHKQNDQQQQYLIEQQLNLFSNPLPQIIRGQSDVFFKQIYKQQQLPIVSVQIGFQIAKIPIDLHDFVSVLINQIHCQSQQNLKFIIDEDELWATSTIVYHGESRNEAAYNIIESNLRQSLIKTRQIMRQILKQIRQRFDKSQSDEQIMKSIKGTFKKIYKSFQDPNADY